MIRCTAIIFCALAFSASPSRPVSAQTSNLPPVTTAWEGPVILQGGEKPNTLYVPQIEHDGQGVCVAAWTDTIAVSGELHYFNNLARSTDGGLTWGEPFALPDNDRTQPRLIRGLAAGENDVWMAANVTTTFSPLPSHKLDVVISRDSGQTWNEFVDVTSKFPPPPNFDSPVRHFVVAYCGNSAWILVLDDGNTIRYMRSADNGVSWGSAITLAQVDHEVSMNVSSHHSGSGVLITYGDQSRFSFDNGQSFVPTVNAVTGGTDGNGNWVVVGPDSETGGLPVMHSEDNGATYTPIPGPPDTEVMISPAKAAYSESGPIIVVATASVDVLPLPAQVTGLFTITDDLGQTWTPWERFHDRLANTPIDIIATDHHFITDFSLERDLQSYRYQHTKPAAASGWELYE